MVAKKKTDPIGLPRSAIKRIEECVASKVLGVEYGTPLGQLLLAGDLSRPQYDAAVWFAQLEDGYRKAIGLMPVRSAGAESSRAEPIDPDSALGAKIAISDRSNVRAFRSAARAARDCGCAPGAYRAFYAVAVNDVDPMQAAETRAIGVMATRCVSDGLRKFREVMGRGKNR